MAKRETMRMQILRRGRREDQISVVADRDDPEELGQHLANWLTARHWHRDRWPEFTATVESPGGLVEVHPVL